MFINKYTIAGAVVGTAAALTGIWYVVKHRKSVDKDIDLAEHDFSEICHAIKAIENK